ncbi:hypothetical protein EU97_1691 [Prochlorococcus marinus str. MIT 9311]|nr:hypothetical protein EU97_1691 [Prochlorococcus marinus str. MIT 9311]
MVLLISKIIKYIKNIRNSINNYPKISKLIIKNVASAMEMYLHLNYCLISN